MLLEQRRLPKKEASVEQDFEESNNHRCLFLTNSRVSLYF